MKKNHIVVISICCVILVAIAGVLYYNKVQKDMYISVMKYIYNPDAMDYSKAIEKMYEVYPTNYNKHEEMIEVIARKWAKSEGIPYTTEEFFREKLYIDDFKKIYTPDLYVKPYHLGVDALELYGDSYTKDGKYATISGSAKNIDDKTISYYKITIKLMDDSGNVLDSIWTNNSGQFNPKESSKWEKSFEDDEKYKQYRLEVTEVVY